MACDNRLLVDRPRLLRRRIEARARTAPSRPRHRRHGSEYDVAARVQRVRDSLSSRRSRSCPRSARATCSSPRATNQARTGTRSQFTAPARPPLDRACSAARPRRSARTGSSRPLTLDGGDRRRHLHVNLIGGRTDSLINVFDTGRPDGDDSLTINGTDNPDVFLLRAATADDGLAFVALINGPTPLTRRPPIRRACQLQHQPRGDHRQRSRGRRPVLRRRHARHDHAQRRRRQRLLPVRPALQSRRTPALAGVAPEDVFATIETTQGWLCNGVSKPMTINGGVGDDIFIVFHNLASSTSTATTATTRSLVQAFALAGSQDDHRALTDLSGGAGRRPDPVRGQRAGEHRRRRRLRHGDRDRHRVQRRLRGHRPTACSAPASTSTSSTSSRSTVDGGAGDDRFFVLSTGPTSTTEIDGGLGSDLISVDGARRRRTASSERPTRPQRHRHPRRRERRRRIVQRASTSSASRRTSPTTTRRASS